MDEYEVRVIHETEEWVTSNYVQQEEAFEKCQEGDLNRAEIPKVRNQQVTLEEFWDIEEIQVIEAKTEAIRKGPNQVLFILYAAQGQLEVKVKAKESMVEWVCNCMKTRVNMKFLAEVRGIEFKLV